MLPQKKLSRSKKLAATVALALLLHPLAARAQVQTELWDGQRALGAIAELLRFTPRSMDTAGHQKTIDFIKAELAKTRPTSSRRSAGSSTHLTASSTR